VSATSVRCTSPVRSAGATTIAISNNNLAFSSTQAFTYYAAPTLASLAPVSSGVLGMNPRLDECFFDSALTVRFSAGGTIITLVGTGFAATPTIVVLFGQDKSSACTLIGSTTVECTTPAHSAGVVQVRLSNNAVDFTNDVVEFTYIGT
jgi:hypothetical protein